MIVTLYKYIPKFCIELAELSDVLKIQFSLFFADNWFQNPAGKCKDVTQQKAGKAGVR